MSIYSYLFMNADWMPKIFHKKRDGCDAMEETLDISTHTHIGIGERWGCLYQRWAYSSEENEALSEEREHVERTLQDK